MNAPRRSLVTEHPAFGFFWFGRIAGALSFQMQGVVVGWQVYAMTNSVFQLGLIGLAQFLPIVLLMLPVGHAADRYDRRMICVVALVAQGAAIAFLALGSGGHWITVPEIFAAVTLVGAARAFDRPSSQSLLPTLVPESLVPSASAWSSGAFQAATAVGPALGGLLYAFGPAVPYALAAAFGFAGAALTFAIHRERSVRPSTPISRHSLFAGLRFIRGEPIILGSISLDLFAVLLGGATALLPVFARDILRTGPWGLGVLRAAPAVGSIAMSVWLVRRPLRGRVGRAMFAAVLVFGVATIVFGLSRSFPLTLAALFVLGAADAISVVIRSSLVQLRTPDSMRGRVSAVNSLFIGTADQFGEFESGATAALLGTVPATVFGGIGTIVVALLWMKFFPALRNCDRLE